VYFLSNCRESDGGCGCFYGSRESIAAIDRAVWVVLRQAQMVVAVVLGRHGLDGTEGGVHAEASGEIEAGVAGSCGT
jgi:hypothetical protein